MSRERIIVPAAAGGWLCVTVAGPVAGDTIAFGGLRDAKTSVVWRRVGRGADAHVGGVCRDAGCGVAGRERVDSAGEREHDRGAAERRPELGGVPERGPLRRSRRLHGHDGEDPGAARDAGARRGMAGERADPAAEREPGRRGPGRRPRTRWRARARAPAPPSATTRTRRRTCRRWSRRSRPAGSGRRAS